MLTKSRAIFRTVRSLRRAGDNRTIFPDVALPNLRRKASNTWSAVQETYLSTKQVFESHRVVFTVGTSIASVLTAWAGYSIREYHHSNVEKRLGSIEEAIKKNSNVEREEIKKMVTSGNVSTTACVATAWTCLILGYGLGWRGGAWYASRKFRREQLKLMGQLKPNRWQLLRRPIFRLRNARTVNKTEEISTSSSLHTQQMSKSC